MWKGHDMAVYGMNLKQGHELASKAKHLSEQVNKVAEKLEREIAHLNWWGPDAIKFRDEVLAEISRQLTAVKDRARELSDTANANRDAQHDTSMV
jgi:hypothetical protein